MTEMLILPLRKFSPDMKSLLLRSLHQICSVLHSVDFHRKLLQEFQELSTSAAGLKKRFPLQMVGLDQVTVLCRAQLPHGRRPAACPDHIPVIGHRLAVKLDQTAAAALAQLKGHSLILLHGSSIRNILGRSRGRCQLKEARFRQKLPAGYAMFHKFPPQMFWQAARRFPAGSG